MPKRFMACLPWLSATKVIRTSRTTTTTTVTETVPTVAAAMTTTTTNIINTTNTTTTTTTTKICATPTTVMTSTQNDDTCHSSLQPEPSAYDEACVSQLVDDIMAEVDARLAGTGFDGATVAAIANATREGCTAAAITVNRELSQRTTKEIKDDIRECCRKVAKAVIDATAATPGDSKLFEARAAAKCITHAAHYCTANNKHVDMPYTCATQIAFTAEGVAAAIVHQILAGDPGIGDVPMLWLTKYLPEES
ncbi:hypothetical protein F4802DRAFT_586966 [Xylaria palmicola]|nr:hypothetical protein F4802DRAFT_586966 [Xylaria palmicola]